ncbi:MAG: broad specificity phosphatase PhoE [Parvibaculaceae bacterium]|jgi:broad specificity phosphatase PhoE|nr:phosphoglycerate mutase family protein [Parvibaculaceae bacterium]
MARIYMIRHGKAAAGWGEDKNPGLDDTGRAQAEQAADNIQAQISTPIPVLTSPLKRCQETAVPLASRWAATPLIDPRVAELPSPMEDLTQRGEWLRGVMGGTWDQAIPAQGAHPDYGKTLDEWRAGIVTALNGCTQDTVIFSHFIAINVAVGHAQQDNRVLCFKPDNGSITTFETDGKNLSLISLGGEADTKVN